MSEVVHWTGEVRGPSVEVVGGTSTDDKSKVTCQDCLFIIEALEDANRRKKL